MSVWVIVVISWTERGVCVNAGGANDGSKLTWCERVSSDSESQVVSTLLQYIGRTAQQSMSFTTISFTWNTVAWKSKYTHSKVFDIHACRYKVLVWLFMLYVIGIGSRGRYSTNLKALRGWVIYKALSLLLHSPTITNTWGNSNSISGRHSHAGVIPAHPTACLLHNISHN